MSSGVFSFPTVDRKSEWWFSCSSRRIPQAPLESIANTLADGVVEENELNATIPKLEAVIQECASVRYLLETLCKNRKKKTKK